MQVIVRSHHAEVTTALRTAVQRKLARIERIARDAARADVQFSEERNPRISGSHVCAVTIQLRHGSVTAHAAASDPLDALDDVLAKVRHQVERLKGLRVSGGARRASRRDRTRS